MQRNTEDYAIVVGIDTYTILPRLSGATKDATEFAQWLVSPEGGGLLPEKVIPILSPEKVPKPPELPQPIQLQIDEALKSFNIINRRGRIGRRLYFYFSGHGYALDDDVGLFMANASYSQANFNIGLRQYKNFLTRWGFFEEIVFILDCCRSPIYKATIQEPSFTLDPPYPEPFPIVDDFVALATLYGTPSFSTWDDAEGRKRGILTRAVLEGLRDELAADREGRITASSLREYVKWRVPEIARQHNIEQKAQVFPPSLDEIIFKEGVRKQQKIGIQIPAGVNEITIWNDEYTEIAQYTLDAALNNWRFKYLVEEDDLKRFVLHGDEAVQQGNDTIIRVILLQNAIYGLQPSGGRIRPLDLRKVDTHNSNFVFKL